METPHLRTWYVFFQRRIQTPSTRPASTGKMMARRIEMKKERKVQSVNTSSITRIVTALYTSHGTSSPRRRVRVLLTNQRSVSGCGPMRADLAVTRSARMMLVAARAASTISSTLWCASTRSSPAHTACVT